MIDLSLDYHAHILPGCDHGSRDIETSLMQLKMAQKAEIYTICATPHFYPQRESVDSFLERREKTSKLLFQEMTENSPKIRLGAEVLICEGMENLENLSKLCLEGTNELLLEMPFYKWHNQIWDTLYELMDHSEIQIVVAHADRYPVEDIQRLIDEEIPLQLNAECLINPFRRRKYLSWIKDGYVSFLCSDIHELNSGYTDFMKSRKIIERYCR